MTSVSQVAVYLPEVEFYSARSGGAPLLGPGLSIADSPNLPAVVLGPETSGG